MATSYDRRINLYLNGSQVSHDVKSIRAEMTLLVNQQARMTLGSQEYIAHARRIQGLRPILAAHNRQIAAIGQSWSMASIGTAFNNYQALAMGAIAAVTGFVLGFKALVSTFNDYEERVDNLSALTGLAGRNLDWLSQKAKDMSVSVLEGGIRVTQGAQDIVDAFTKVGSARPELLKNKEALASVTAESIILSNAAKTELQPAIEALCMVMNQYNAPATEARRIINALGAGSKEGAGEIPYLTRAFEKAGTVAADAGISIETLVATVETLAPRIKAPEIAGRSLKGVLLDMQQGADDVNPAVVGLATALTNLGKKNLDITELTKLFGKENITTAKILLNNVDELKKYEKAVTGTNIAVEQAAINTNNNNSKLAQAGNRIALVSMELGQKLAPSMTLVTGYFGAFLRSLSSLLDIFATYGRLIYTVIAAVTAYVITMKLQEMWTMRVNRETLAQMIISKAHAVLVTIQTIGTQLWAIAYALLTGNITAATIAFRALNTAMKTNSLGIIVSAIVAAGTAIYGWVKATKEASAAADVHAQMLADEKNALSGYSDAIVKEKAGLQSLVNVIMQTNDNEALRGRLIENLKNAYPAFIGFMKTEEITNASLALRLAEVNKNYTEKIRLAALNAKSDAITNASVKGEERKLAIEERLVEIDKESYKTSKSSRDKEVAALNTEYNTLNITLADYAKRQTELTSASTTLQSSLTAFDTLPYVEGQLSGLETARTNYNAKLKKATEEANAVDVAYYSEQVKRSDAEIKMFKDKREALLASANAPKGKATGSEEDADEAKTKDLIKLKQKELEAIQAVAATTKEELAARNRKVEAIQKEITALQQLGTAKQGKESPDDKEAMRNRLEAVEAANKAEVASINKKHLETGNSEDQYNADLLKQEFNFLAAKLALYKAGTKEYEAVQAESLTKQVKAEQKVKDLLLAAQKELADAKMENIQDGIQKEKASENNRWVNELADLNKKMIVKTDLNKGEVAVNDAIKETITQKTVTHNKTINDLDVAAINQKQMDAALIQTANAQGDQETWDAEMAIANAQYQEELLAANGNGAKMATAERKLSDKVLAIKIDELNKRETLGNAVLNLAVDGFGAMSELVGKETALGKAFYLAQQAAAVGQIIFNTAIANSKAVAMSPETFGQPWVTINTISAAVSIATVLAQAIGTLSGGSKKSKSTGFETGGFTGDGEKSAPAGIVHRGEYVIPRDGVNNPKLIPILNLIESARQTNKLTRLDLIPEIQAMSQKAQYATGGYVPLATVVQTPGTPSSGYASLTASSHYPDNVLSGTEHELKQALLELNKILKTGIRAEIPKWGNNGLSDAMDDISKFNSKIFKK
jgi:TP901 family phage tail tape measure protein